MIFKVEKRRFRKMESCVSRVITTCAIGSEKCRGSLEIPWGDRQTGCRKEGATNSFRKRSREAAGILEPKVIRTAAMRPLAAHLEDYLSDLEKRNRAGRNGRGGRQLKMRVTTLLNECNWNVAFNVNADSFIAWRSRQKNSARTLNHYLQAMVSFLNWMERVGRIKGNPLKFVGKIDERGQSKRVRRAFTDDELRRLVTGSGVRGIVYFVAARTGLRQEELRQLIWDDLRFDEKVPHVRVRVICAKNKTEEHVALVPEIAEALKAHRPANYSPSDLVFQNGVPQARRLRRDSERNGIAYCDESGRYADFHALRYTWATFLQRHGIAQRFAMKLLRHSDIKLTSKLYTDESQLPIYEAVKGLPRLLDHTQIRAQISDAVGENLSQADASSEGNQAMELADNKGNGRMLTLPVALGRVAVREGFEPSVPFWGTAL